MGIFRHGKKKEFNDVTDRALEEYKQIRQGFVTGTRYSSVDEMMNDILDEDIMTHECDNHIR